VECRWTSPEPPEKLRVRWDEQQAILPLNVEDGRALPEQFFVDAHQVALAEQSAATQVRPKE
jgi:hypothetical protein